MGDLFGRVGRALRRELGFVRGQVAGLAVAESAQRFEARQVAKATLAAVVAWLVADRVLSVEQTLWMAPATAVIMVHATVYRSLTSGARRVIGVAAGVVLAGTIGHLMGLSALSLLLVVPLALAAGRWHRLGGDGADVATTAVLLLSFGAGSQDRYLLGYAVATAVGAVVGGVVNAVLWPPLYRRRTLVAVRLLGRESAGLMNKVAAGLRAQCDLSGAAEWKRHAVWLDTHTTRAAAAIAKNAESRRFNLRRIRRPVPRDDAQSVEALEQIGVHLHTVVRTLDQVDRRQRYDRGAGGVRISPEFGCFYADLLEVLSQVIDTQARRPEDNADISALLGQAQQQADALAKEMTGAVAAGNVDHLAGWAEVGSLFTDAERIIDILTLLLGNPRRPPSPDPTTATTAT